MQLIKNSIHSEFSKLLAESSFLEIDVKFEVSLSSLEDISKFTSGSLLIDDVSPLFHRFRAIEAFNIRRNKV